jgi:hypothetical protein
LFITDKLSWHQTQLRDRTSLKPCESWGGGAVDQLFYGDNLNVLRASIKDEIVDLIYLDPPFNSNANYNVLFKSPTGADSPAQIEAFEDTWNWGPQAEALLIRSLNPATPTLLICFGLCDQLSVKTT